MLPDNARSEFDRVFETIVEKLPADVKKLMETLPILIEDEPSDEVLEEVGLEPGAKDTELCGVHSGIALNQRTLWETPLLPGAIHLFRGPIYRIARGSREVLRKQIEITFLHELGHHFGFDHAKLQAMGYR